MSKVWDHFPFKKQINYNAIVSIEAKISMLSYFMEAAIASESAKDYT